MKRLILVLILALTLPATVYAQLYGVSLNGHSRSDYGPSSLYSIDPGTGAGTLIGDMGYAVNSIAVDPTTGIMYASEAQWDHNSFFGQLLEIDPATGAGTPVGPFGGMYCCRTLTFDSAGQLWGWTENGDDPVMIDKSTGAATLVGNSGVNTVGQVMSFDSTDVLRLFMSSSIYVINQSTGVGTLESSLGFDPGAGGGVIDPAGSLWAPRDNGRTQDSFIRITDYVGNSYTDINTDVEYLNALTLGDVSAVMGTARFAVTKTFSDQNEGEVEVTLTCNGGLPLQQSFTIAGGGPGVTFVVTDLPDGGANCEVTESSDHENYTTVMNGDMGCAWTGVSGGLRSCAILNEAKPAEYTVSKTWLIDDNQNEEADYDVDVTITCLSEIIEVDGDSHSGTTTTVTLGDGDSVDVLVDTLLGDTGCSATEEVVQSGVESEASAACTDADLTAGSSAECVFTNTVFFEGIPTLSQYGMALMALLMLGVGFVGFRRFI